MRRRHTPRRAPHPLRVVGDGAAPAPTSTYLSRASKPRAPHLAADHQGDYVANSTEDAAGDARDETPATATTAVGATAGPERGRAPLPFGEVVELFAEAVAQPLDDQDTDQIRDRIRLLQRVEGLTTVAMARAIRRLDAAGGVADDGASSSTAWLAEHTGRSRRSATRTVRLGSTLDDLPATAAALADGSIAPESADAIVQTARDGSLGSPAEAEAALIDVATTEGPERVRQVARARAQERDGAAMLRDENRQHQRRRASLTPRDDGMWHLAADVSGTVGNKLRTLLDVFDVPDAPETPEGQRRRPDQRMADALEAVADAALGLGDLPTHGGVARPHVSVIVDLATFDADLTDPDDPSRPVRPDHPIWAELSGAETEWAGMLSPQAARGLCCDAGVSRIVTIGPSQVLDVGRETRNWSASQRRAVNARDRSCRGPGCRRPIGWTQIHHLQWWENDGVTSVDNGLAVCTACHDLIHNRGWHAELDVTTAAVTWTSPDRRRTVVTHPRPPS